MAIVFECSDDIMTERVMKRAETSGRVDDNPETVKKRLTTHHLTTEPIIEHFEQYGKIKKVRGQQCTHINTHDRIWQLLCSNGHNFSSIGPV